MIELTKNIPTKQIIILGFVFLLIFLFIVYYLDSSENGFFRKIIIILIVVSIIFGILIFNYYKININTFLKQKNPEIDLHINKPINNIPKIRIENQVFHIPENNYTYQDAKAICKAYGSTLANYSQIEEAYKKGGEWCSYGWSADQMAFFPTQEKTYQYLQGIKGHEHDCGRPGVNGGYIANPNAKFGVNCYGNKPKITPEEEENMKILPIYPVTKEEQEFQQKVEMWKNKLNELIVSPFNSSYWSQPII
jgi:hypothetical protein